MEVTDRNRPVALLVPVRGDGWHDLLATGRVSPPSAEGDVLDEASSEYGIDASGELETLRDDEP